MPTFWICVRCQETEISVISLLGPEKHLKITQACSRPLVGLTPQKEEKMGTKRGPQTWTLALAASPGL